jgi:hypothetical protein
MTAYPSQSNDELISFWDSVFGSFLGLILVISTRSSSLWNDEVNRLLTTLYLSVIGIGLTLILLYFGYIEILISLYIGAIIGIYLTQFRFREPALYSICTFFLIIYCYILYIFSSLSYPDAGTSNNIEVVFIIAYVFGLSITIFIHTYFGRLHVENTDAIVIGVADIVLATSGISYITNGNWGNVLLSEALGLIISYGICQYFSETNNSNAGEREETIFGNSRSNSYRIRLSSTVATLLWTIILFEFLFFTNSSESTEKSSSETLFLTSISSFSLGETVTSFHWIWFHGNLRIRRENNVLNPRNISGHPRLELPDLLEAQMSKTLLYIIIGGYSLLLIIAQSFILWQSSLSSAFIFSGTIGFITPFLSITYLVRYFNIFESRMLDIFHTIVLLDILTFLLFLICSYEYFVMISPDHVVFVPSPTESPSAFPTSMPSISFSPTSLQTAVFIIPGSNSSNSSSSSSLNSFFEELLDYILLTLFIIVILIIAAVYYKHWMETVDTQQCQESAPIISAPSLPMQDTEDNMCVICMVNPRRVVLLHEDGGHYCTCETCSNIPNLSTCPICRQIITSKVRNIYL